jgi:hypothetical protein
MTRICLVPGGVASLHLQQLVEDCVLGVHFRLAHGVEYDVQRIFRPSRSARGSEKPFVKFQVTTVVRG